MPTPLMNLRVPTEERARWARAAEGASLSLSRWIRDTLNAAAAATVEAQEERRAEAVRRRRELERPARVREVEAWHRGQVAEAERPGPTAGPEPPAVEPPAVEVEGEPAEELWRPGRCRDHPGAWPRRFDLGRCAWGCRLP